MNEWTHDEIRSAWRHLHGGPLTQQVIVMGPTAYVLFRAALDFQGRNWRRVKREMRKALKKAKRGPQRGLPKPMADFWTGKRWPDP